MKIAQFVIAFVVFIVGMATMGYAFYIEGFEAPVFLAGILVVSASVAIPVHLLTRID